MQKIQRIAKKSVYWLKVISLGLILGLGIQFAQAWVNPTAAPPGGNVGGPLTTGTGNQVKTSGNITLSGAGNLLAGGYVAAPAICIGTDCRNAWPTATGDNLGNHIATANLNMGANNIVAGGSSGGNYGALTIQGSDNGYSGINFKNISGSDVGTLMMHPGASGFYDENGGAWRWYVNNEGSSYQPGSATAADFCTAGGKCLSSAGGSGGWSHCVWSGPTQACNNCLVQDFCPAGYFVAGESHSTSTWHTDQFYCCKP